MTKTLFVTGFNRRTRARDLAYEFERYGRLVRCDIPAPKAHSAESYAFVEFENPRDANIAFDEMHGRRLDGSTISVQWARNRPRSSWRYDHRPRSPDWERGGGRSHSRPRSPPRRRSVSPRRERYRQRSYSPGRRGDEHFESPRLSPYANRNYSRSPSPREWKSP